jgi:beta-fructofuranosidase
MPDLSADPHRPIYHFLPPDNWMNDPNGPIFYQGRYHLMYQYAPDVANGWGAKHWGHAVSDDLVHWEHLPIALSPDQTAGDQDGCYTGSAVLDDDGTPTILYTGVHPQVQCIARSRDGMQTWDKPACNPVIAEPPAGIDPKNFRDPCLWREDDGWYMVIGSGIEGVGGRALLYRSRDLMDWEYLHPLCEGVAAETGDMWECPDFFALGDRHVLLISALGEQLYFIGHYDDATHHFEPESDGRIGGGVCYYAAKSFVDGDGRRILWGWLRERRDREAQIAAGWSGVMSLPQALTMLPGGRLGIEPASEIEALRGQALVDDAAPDLSGIHGDALEIEIEVEVAGDAVVELGVRCTPDGGEETTVRYDGATQMIELDMTRSSVGTGLELEVNSRPLALAMGEALRLRVFVDRSAIEVYANGRECVVGRVYPTRSDAVGLRMRTSGDATVNGLRVWRMPSIW